MEKGELNWAVIGCGIARKLKAELWGGIILVIIGLKILIEHLFLQ